MSHLKNEVAVIRGGTSGIGLATAHRSVVEGAHVLNSMLDVTKSLPLGSLLAHGLRL
jgi:NAD(P)-dependent dehydrogenase (short-subunit alcohol dehydrogenase family)